MSQAPLPRELVSLVHYVELNKAGWWDKAIQRLIVASVWLSSNNPTYDEILSGIHTYFQIDIDRARARSQLSTLLSTGVLVSLPGELFKISESFITQFEKDLAEAERIEYEAKKIFTAAIQQHCSSLDPQDAWQKFNEQFLLPLVRDIGANTYNLISGTHTNLHTIKFEDFLQNYPPEFHKPFRAALNIFLNPKNPDVRSYILRSLNAWFFLEASNLREETLSSLTKMANLRPSFTFFIDTNFLFSVLGLHENPSNEAALLLTQTVKHLTGKVSVKLFVLPPTLDETRRVLTAVELNIKDLRLTPNLAEAALETPLSGMAQKFIRDSLKDNAPPSAELYINPYVRDLITIIRSRGADLYNERLDNYKTDQRVIDDINVALNHQKNLKGKTKTYEQLEHDIILWHFVQDKRPTRIESPLDAHYWIVTVDYRFMGYDEFKRRGSEENIPICIHPTTLINLLQFWIARTPEFEEALLSSMRLPFLFQEFDPQAERVTIRILEALGRFENVGDIPKETVTAILINEALRQKLSREADAEKDIELVREALVEEYQKASQRLKELSEESEHHKREALHFKTDADQKQAAIGSLQEMIQTQEEKLLSTDQRLQEEQKVRESLQEKVNQLGEVLHLTREEYKRRKVILDLKAEKQARRRLWIYLSFLGLVYLGLAISIYIFTWNVMEPWTYLIGLGVLLVSYAYFAVTLQEASPTGIYQQIVIRRKRKIYKETGFDLEEYEGLVSRMASSDTTF
ncbi:MAG: hypothetical protein AB1757_18695 [Acidobacteriota bacterium]